jgi:hypothetical protein
LPHHTLLALAATGAVARELPGNPGLAEDGTRRAHRAQPAAAVAVERWIRLHRLSLVIVAGLLVTVQLVHWIGYDRFPSRATDDEGTYVSPDMGGAALRPQPARHPFQRMVYLDNLAVM